MPDYDASDPKAVADAKAAEGRRLKKLDDFVAAALTTAEGRFWFWNLLVECHIFQPVFVAGQPDTTAFRDGERNIGLQILSRLVRVAPDAYALMQKENTRD